MCAAGQQPHGHFTLCTKIRSSGKRESELGEKSTKKQEFAHVDVSVMLFLAD